MSTRQVKRFLTLTIASMFAFCSFSALAEKHPIKSTLSPLDPNDASNTLSQAVAKSFYQGLFSFDKDMHIKNALAENYHVSDDRLEYTFNLRQGVKFHDSSDFKAETVKANFVRVSNPDNHLKHYNTFKGIVITEVIAPYTVNVILSEPYSVFINMLAHPSAVMISPDAMTKYGKKIAFHPVGTGPFTLVKWNPTDSLKVKKFADYRQQGLPKVDTITWYPVVDTNTRAAFVQTGEVDFAFSIPFEHTSVLKKNPNLELVSPPSIIMHYVSFNMLQKPYDDIRIRQAINYAINRDALVKVAFAGYAAPAEGIVPQGIDFAQSYRPWPYDPNKARPLLKVAGYPDGFETTLWSGYNSTTAQKVIQYIQQQLALVGIKAKIETLESGRREMKIQNVKDPAQAEVRMYYIGWSASTGESDYALTPLFATSSWVPVMFNFSYYNNTEVDKSLEQALKTTDREQKAEIYKKVQDTIWADVLDSAGYRRAPVCT